MQLPQENIIQEITNIVNKQFNREGITFKLHLKKDGYCSLIPKGDKEVELKGILKPLRNKFKNVYVWIDSKYCENKEICVINFFQKHF